MGYGMAVNLRTKMDPTMNMVICDVNQAAVEKFQQQMQGKGNISVVGSGAEASGKAVSQMDTSQSLQRGTVQPRLSRFPRLSLHVLGYCHHNASRSR